MHGSFEFCESIKAEKAVSVIVPIKRKEVTTKKRSYLVGRMRVGIGSQLFLLDLMSENIEGLSKVKLSCLESTFLPKRDPLVNQSILFINEVHSYMSVSSDVSIFTSRSSNRSYYHVVIELGLGSKFVILSNVVYTKCYVDLVFLFVYERT
jgi:hypothetical protein